MNAQDTDTIAPDNATQAVARQAVTGLRGITVWDGVTDLGPTDLTWAGDRFDEVKPAPTDQYSGLAVMPGLVDTNVQLSGPALVDERRDYTPGTWTYVTTRETQTMHAAALAVRAMRSGITTMRDTAGDSRQIAIRDAFDAGLLVGPRMFVAGKAAMTAGTPAGEVSNARTADGPVACRTLVRTYAELGVDAITVAASGGVRSRGEMPIGRHYSRAEFSVIIDEAHALGLPVIAHAQTETGIEVALAEGVDGLDHATLITGPQADRAAEVGIPIAPALGVNDRLADGRMGQTEQSRADARELVSHRDVRLRKAREAGAPFVLGSHGDGHRIGFATAHAELARHRDVLGLTDAKALASGTSEAAEALGVGDRVGRIAPGYGADFLVLRSRPWKGISSLTAQNIVAVVCRGQVVAGALPEHG